MFLVTMLQFLIFKLNNLYVASVKSVFKGDTLHKLTQGGPFLNLKKRMGGDIISNNTLSIIMRWAYICSSEYAHITLLLYLFLDNMICYTFTVFSFHFCFPFSNEFLSLFFHVFNMILFTKFKKSAIVIGP